MNKTTCVKDKMMTEDIPDDELWELAIDREIKAYWFYRMLAKNTNDPDIADVLEDLAKEELRHKAALELEVIKTGKVVEIKEIDPDAEPEQFIADTDYKLDISYREALLIAIEKEDASFRTYIDLLTHTHDEQTREILIGIAEEEMKHKIQFETEYDRATKKGLI